MFADPKEVKNRRLRRRLKAGAAVALAMVAGAFLACKGEEKAPEPPSPSGPDARSGPGTKTAVAEDAGVDAANDTADMDAAADAEIDASSDAPSDAIIVADASADGSAGLAVRKPSAPKKPLVDKREHRKGMPVRDNLLE